MEQEAVRTGGVMMLGGGSLTGKSKFEEVVFKGCLKDGSVVGLYISPLWDG